MRAAKSRCIAAVFGVARCGPARLARHRCRGGDPARARVPSCVQLVRATCPSSRARPSLSCAVEGDKVSMSNVTVQIEHWKQRPPDTLTRVPLQHAWHSRVAKTFRYTHRRERGATGKRQEHDSSCRVRHSHSRYGREIRYCSTHVFPILAARSVPPSHHQVPWRYHRG